LLQELFTVGWDICGSFTRPKTRRGGAAKSHPSLCGSWLLASRAYSSRSGLLTTMIRCRYQELDLAECHAVATAVCHCAAASAHCPQTGLRRSGTDGSPIPRRRKRDSNFWSHLQRGQPCAELASPFFRARLPRLRSFFISENDDFELPAFQGILTRPAT